MIVDVHLSTNRKWTSAEGTHVTGAAYRDGELLDGEELWDHFDGTVGASDFAGRLNELNGFFSVVLEVDDEVLAGLDHVGTIPLFYGTTKGDGYVSDDPYWIVEQVGDQAWSRSAVIEYGLLRFVTGSETLHPDVKQLQAGQRLAGPTAGSFDVQRYYHHELVAPTTTDEERLLEELDELLVAAFERLIEFADGRPIAVSLSGGYDSRLLSSMLKRLEYEEVVAVTCNKGSAEDVANGRQVAENLGLPWAYADLDHDDWRACYESEDWERYHETAGALSSCPFVFDLPPIQHLRSRGELPEDAVFVAGHTAVDTVRPMNEYLRSERAYSGTELTDAVLGFHVCQWDYNGEEIDRRLRDKILSIVGATSFDSRLEAVDAYERWRWLERESKYIYNHVRVYEYLDHDWWLPLEDRPLMDFWNRCPLDLKVGKRLYHEYIERLYADVAGLPLEEARLTTGDSRLLRTLDDLVSKTPLKSVATDAYLTYRDVKASLAERFASDYWERRYESDPRYGVMPKEGYEQVTDRVESFEGFHSLEQLGLLSFDAPGEATFQRDGTFRWDMRLPAHVEAPSETEERPAT